MEEDNILYAGGYSNNPEDKDKYIVISCAKYEDDYVVEWVEHYLKLGFDKLIIADNNDEETLPKILEKYIENGTVELLNYRGTNLFQLAIYSKFCDLSNYKWCAYYDMDEFLELPSSNNVKEYLDKVDPNVDVVCFNWLIFGDNGQYFKTEGSVQERFKSPLYPIIMHKENMFFKSIVRGCEKFHGCQFSGSHFPISVTDEVLYSFSGKLVKEFSQVSFPPKYKDGYIKHYYTKSYEEWLRKAQRGWPDGTNNLETYKYIFLKSYEIPFDVFKYDLFSVNYQEGDYKTLSEEYDVIEITYKKNDERILITCATKLLTSMTGHTFIIREDIDDSLYAILLEIALRTGNNLVFCRTDDDVWNIYLKYSKGKNYTYYKLYYY